MRILRLHHGSTFALQYCHRTTKRLSCTSGREASENKTFYEHFAQLINTLEGNALLVNPT